MKRERILLIAGTILLLGTASFGLAQSDTILSDTLIVNEGLIAEMGSETRALSDYFSFPKLLLTLLIIGLTYLFLRVVSGLLNVWGERTTRHRVTIKGFIPVVRILIWLGSFSFIIVAIFRPPMASVLAISASIGVAVGFAAQDLLKNIFGGIIIIIDKPFQIGDKIQIGSHYGEVTGIGLRSTRLVTPSDSLVTVPNAEVMSQAVANANAGEENCQVVTEVYLPLNVDIAHIKQTALEAAQVSRYVFLNKPVVVLFSQEDVGQRVLLKVKVKAYVNDLRNEFLFQSEITEVLTKEFASFYSDNDLQ
ncbi:MAG: mechanosensitive ion channel [Bacteroidia bacterium]|nr:MAG: mechanosensitive ion channel [Bacteroidia bacterium]